MRQSSRVFIPIPKVKNTKCKVEIAGDDQTTRIIESNWIKPAKNGIGTFNLQLSNAKGQYSGSYKSGDIVKFYGDNTDGTTLQFWGRIDYVKDDISNQGQFLNIEGRHRAYLLTEYLICHSATETEPSQILKDIIDKLPSDYGGFTYSNVAASTTTMNVEWNYKPFWDCVVEICNKAGFDCYVDDDLDFHFFEENSIENTNDAIVEGDNFIKCKDYGTNDYYEKTRVTAMGQDDVGLPIIYTAISPDEETDIKEIFIKDSSANTLEKVKDIAEAKLYEVTNKNPQAIITSLGLESINPGDNIWILVPRQKISAQYKLSQINHKFGMKTGGWRTECVIEEEEAGISTVIKNLSQTSQKIMRSENVNKLNYSYNLTFDSDSGTHDNTIITEGVLKTNATNSGTWISDLKTASEDATYFELRAIGESLVGTSYYVSTDAGSTWQEVSALKDYIAFSQTGKNLKIKIILNSADTQIKSLAVLYS